MEVTRHHSEYQNLRSSLDDMEGLYEEMKRTLIYRLVSLAVLVAIWLFQFLTLLPYATGHERSLAQAGLVGVALIFSTGCVIGLIHSSAEYSRTFLALRESIARGHVFLNFLIEKGFFSGAEDE